ncbi:IS1 family transposase [Enterobacter intestinihominis]
MNLRHHLARLGVLSLSLSKSVVLNYNVIGNYVKIIDYQLVGNITK